MKRLLTFIFVLLPLFSFAQDDMYFTSSKKAKKAVREVVEDVRAKTETVEEPVLVDYNSSNRSDDEYNRRYVYGGDFQNAGGLADDSLAARIDTVAGSESDASLLEMDDPEVDFRFSRRIVRFHNPRLYALASPYYWDLYYVYGAWDYLYDPYDPWYWHYGWSYGWTWGPWDCWYGGIWGWHRPCAWSYWGWGPSWGRPIYGIVHERNTVPRELNSSRGYMSASRRLRTSATGGTSLGARTSAANARSSASASRTSSRASRTNAQAVRGDSYSEYANSRTGRTNSVSSRGQQVQNDDRSRANAAQRSSATRRSTSQPSRSSVQNGSRSSNSRSYENSSSRAARNSTPTYSTPSYSAPSRSSAGGSMGGGSRGGGSMGGGSRSGGRR